MAHAIFVRSTARHGLEVQPLAYDIDSLDAASSLAEGIAGSYPMHGRDDAQGTFWFVDRRGLHELLIL